jgi:hypothetical protein
MMNDRPSVYDEMRFKTEYRDTFNTKDNKYRPDLAPSIKIADTRPGMLRSLDFTPSTD